jgi:hypothetical protein
MPAEDFVKGIVRALTADAVGGPVDLANAAVNLGKAGYGYLGHKMGLLTPEQMPDLEDKPFGGSDFFAGQGKASLADTGTGSYSRGRLAGTLAPVAVGLAGAVPRQPKGQLNSSLLVPEQFLRSRGLASHGNAKIETPFDGTIRPIDATPDFTPLLDRAQKFTLADVYPKLQGRIPELARMSVEIDPTLGPKTMGSYTPSTFTTRLNPNQPLSSMMESVIHEGNHGMQGISGMLGTGSNAGYFKLPDYIDSFTKGAEAFSKRYPSQRGKIQDYLSRALADPHLGYRSNEGETLARIGQAFPGQTTAPSQNQFDMLTRMNGGFADAGILSRVIDPSTNQMHYTTVPAASAKAIGLENRSGVLLDQYGQHFGLSGTN